MTRERVMRCGVLCGLPAIAILIIDLAQQVTRSPAADDPDSVPDFIIFWTGAKPRRYRLFVPAIRCYGSRWRRVGTVASGGERHCPFLRIHPFAASCIATPAE